MCLEGGVESVVSSLFPQFDPFLKINDSKAPVALLFSDMFLEVCNCGFPSLFSSEGKIQPLVICVFLCLALPYWTASLISWSRHFKWHNVWDQAHTGMVPQGQVLLSLWLVCCQCSDTWLPLRWTPAIKVGNALSLNQAAAAPRRTSLSQQHLAGPFSIVLSFSGTPE